MCVEGGSFQQVLTDLTAVTFLFQAYVCTFEVWSQLWLGSIKLIKDDCEP